MFLRSRLCLLALCCSVSTAPDALENTAVIEDCEMSRLKPYESLANCSPSLEAQSWVTLRAIVAGAAAGSPPSECMWGEDAPSGDASAGLRPGLTTIAGALERLPVCTDAAGAVRPAREMTWSSKLGSERSRIVTGGQQRAAPSAARLHELLPRSPRGSSSGCCSRLHDRKPRGSGGAALPAADDDMGPLATTWLAATESVEQGAGQPAQPPGPPRESPLLWDLRREKRRRCAAGLCRTLPLGADSRHDSEKQVGLWRLGFCARQNMNPAIIIATTAKQAAQISGFVAARPPQTPQGEGLPTHWQLPRLQSRPGSVAVHCSVHTHFSSSPRWGSHSGASLLLPPAPRTSTGRSAGQPQVPSTQTRAPGQPASLAHEGNAIGEVPLPGCAG